MSSESQMQLLVARLRAGDQDAAAEVHRRYSAQLCRIAERQLDERLKRRVEGEDIVQSVFGSFFRRTANGEFTIGDSTDLWNLLLRITISKVRTQGTRNRAQKRDIDREAVSIEETMLESLSGEPSPEDAAALLDEIEYAIQGLGADDSQIIRLTMEGYSSSEIASELKCSRWTVRRVLDRMGVRLEDRLLRESSESTGNPAPGQD